MPLNTKQQGDIGVAQAIYWFTLNRNQVSIPNTDSTRYDLIVDNGRQLRKVQCKTTYTRSKEGNPVVSLRTMGGNQSWGGVVKKITTDETDLVWCCVEGKEAYLFNSEDVAGMSTITLGKKYLKYAVMGDSLLEEMDKARLKAAWAGEEW